MKKLLLLLVLLVVPSFSQSILPSTAYRVIRGSGIPPSSGCNTASAVGKVYIRYEAGAVNSTFYVCANTGVLTYAWELIGGGGATTPGGANTQVQFNNSSAFGGDSAFTFNTTTKALSVTGNVIVGAVGTQGKITLNGSTSGSASISVSASGGTLNLGSTSATVDSAGNIVVTGCTGCGAGTGTVTVVGAGILTSTAFMTGGGSQASQTPSATSTLDASGNATFAGKISGTSLAIGTSPPALTPGTGGVPFACGEGTVPSVGAGVGVDVLYCDSTAHKPMLSNNNGSFFGLTQTIASGSKALATGAISSASCTTAQTATATGTLTTDTVIASFNGDPTAVTGYVPLTTGMLTIIAYPTADTVNFKVCNNTSSSITPGAITLNYGVMR